MKNRHPIIMSNNKNKNQARRSGATKKTRAVMPIVLIRTLTVWYVLFWLNVLRGECLDSLAMSLMLYVPGTHERDGRESGFPTDRSPDTEESLHDMCPRATRWFQDQFVPHLFRWWSTNNSIFRCLDAERMSSILMSTKTRTLCFSVWRYWKFINLGNSVPLSSMI